MTILRKHYSLIPYEYILYNLLATTTTAFILTLVFIFLFLTVNKERIIKFISQIKVNNLI